jgi:hypothetical protein
MRPSNTGKSDSQQTAPAKRGFFAAAGERLKRAMSGARAPDDAPRAQEASDGADGEATTSVQAKARALLLQDRTQRSGQAASGTPEAATGTRPKRTSPPPLPTQRMAADAPAQSASNHTDRPSTSRPRRPVRDSKSEALRARLGAAKAALAEAQAKRAAEQANGAEPESATNEASAAEAVSSDSQPQPEAAESKLPEPGAEPQPTAAESKQSEPGAEPQPAAAEQESAGEETEEGAEPIRTLTIARLLARQGYYDRSLSIYDELLRENAEDPELRAEAEQVRAKQTNHHTSS